MSYRAGPKTFSGTYSLGFGDYVTFNLDEPLVGRKQHSEKVIIEGKFLTMMDADGTTMTFKKIN
jgi:hypothetical protein